MSKYQCVICLEPVIVTKQSWSTTYTGSNPGTAHLDCRESEHRNSGAKRKAEGDA